MKIKIISVFVLIFCFFMASGQQWAGSTNTSGLITRDGDIWLHDNQSYRVALGPAWGGEDIGYGTGYLGFNLARNNHSDGIWTFSHDGANNGAVVVYSNIFGDLFISNKATTGQSNGTMEDKDIVDNINFRFLRDGKFVIGGKDLNFSGNYKLFVESGILTEKVKVAVKNSGDWADHVFKPNFKLMSLPDLEKYIAKYSHLPSIPSADDVVTEGIDLGKMDAKLLQKIEELTLYIIELNKKVEALEKDAQVKSKSRRKDRKNDKMQQ